MNKSGISKIIYFIFTFLLLFTACSGGESESGYNNTVTALDVGQAACTLIESDGQFCLIDAGFAGGKTDVSAYLSARGADEIDLMVISHFHHDHTSEVMEIIRNFDVKTVLIPALSAENTPDSYLYESLLADRENGYFILEYAAANKEFDVGSGTVKILADTYNKDLFNNPNNTSVALSYTQGDFVYVNTADIEQETELGYLLDYLPENITLFAAAHHGSKYSNTPRLLEKLSPEYVTISCGESNEYGHPHREFLDRLNAIGAQYYVTSGQGNIVYSIDSGSFRYE